MNDSEAKPDVPKKDWGEGPKLTVAEIPKDTENGTGPGNDGIGGHSGS